MTEAEQEPPYPSISKSLTLSICLPPVFKPTPKTNTHSAKHHHQPLTHRAGGAHLKSNGADGEPWMQPVVAYLEVSSRPTKSPSRWRHLALSLFSSLPHKQLTTHSTPTHHSHTHTHPLKFKSPLSMCVCAPWAARVCVCFLVCECLQCAPVVNSCVLLSTRSANCPSWPTQIAS